MKKLSTEEINRLVSQFSNKTLPKNQWTHQAHIVVGLWHNYHYDFDEALELVKSKIKAYNLSVGTANMDDSGYHETITIFWMRLTKFFLMDHPNKEIEEICNLFLKSTYASKTYPFEYYSRECLFNKKARKEWVDGDLKLVSF